MSAKLPQYSVAVVAVALVVAPVAPWVATTGSAATAAPTASFGERVVYEQRGDVANVTVQASQPATVNIGSGYDGFWLQVRVGSGTTKLRLNTYKAGASDRYPVSEMVWAAEGNVESRALRTTPIDAPLDPAEYHMNVTIDDQERAVGTLVVQERETNDVTARIAPRATDVSALGTSDDVQKATVPTRDATVAREDWLLLHVDATGVRGALEKSRLDGDGGVMRVEFAQRDPPMNGKRNRFTGASVERVFTDGDGEGFRLAVDTGDHDIDPGDEYRISFVIPAASPLAETEQNVTTWIEVVERRVDVNRNGPGEKIIVENETTVRGTTTLTPGTTVNLSARGTGVDPFLRPRTVTVRDDRTFGATFDFSNLDRGREFEFRLPDQDLSIPAEVASPEPETTTETATPTPEPTATPEPTPTATPTPTETATTAEGLTQRARNGTEPTLTQQALRTAAGEEDNGGLVPGFGPVAVLTAIVAALALAVRRR